jgi:hypothetical protein
MRKTYRVLASAIAILVVVQAMMMVWTIAGLFTWIDSGNTLDKSVVEGWSEEPPTFAGSFGFFWHSFIGGVILIPLLGLILLIVSFFAKVPRGVVLAAAIVVSIVVQYFAGILAGSQDPLIGLVHGLNAFILFGLAVFAARSAKEAGSVAQETSPAAM